MLLQKNNIYFFCFGHTWWFKKIEAIIMGVSKKNYGKRMQHTEKNLKKKVEKKTNTTCTLKRFNRPF